MPQWPVVQINRSIDRTHHCFAANAAAHRPMAAMPSSLASGGRYRLGARTSAGTAVFVGDGGVFETPADWKTSRKVTFGPDWRLGRVTNVGALRYDSQGNLFIGENRSDDNNERGRISVFDASGHFVRVFGRGGLKVNSDTRLPGQVGDTMWDIATSPDGRIYVNASLNDEHLFVFQTF